ncbi:MAG TPA: hypothetical protein VFX12_03805 [Vicinamibacterales bacterium]|nr:hypothetical protein [Vicinamibacterales bacterium]
MMYGGSTGPQPSDAPTRGDIEQLRELQLYTLMETRWMRPEVLGMQTDRIGFKRYLVLNTRVGDQLFDFYLDRRTHLPARIVVHTPVPGRMFMTRYDLSDYHAVSGIQFPENVELRDEVSGPYKEHVTYQVNVPYDETVFTRPPSIADGPHGWRVKK